MNTMHRFTLGAFPAALPLGMGESAGVSAQDKRTAIGHEVGK